MTDLINVNDNLTLVDIATNPANYPAEVKSAALDTLKQMKAQIRDFEVNISANVISEMREDGATKIFFNDTKGTPKTLTLKNAPKKFNPAIKDFEQFVIDKGFNHKQLGDIKLVPYSWSKCKELAKQGGKIKEVIEEMYVEGNPSLEIK